VCCVDFSLTRSFQRLQERGANREANSIFAADSTASSPRAPLPASEEEEVGPNRRRIQSPLCIARVSLPVECRWPSVLLVLRSSAEGCGGDGSGVGVGDSRAPPFGVGPGRIKFPWVMLCSHPSFVYLELIGVDDDGAGFGAGIFYGEESARVVIYLLAKGMDLCTPMGPLYRVSGFTAGGGCFFFFLLAVWVDGGLVQFVVLTVWSSGVRGGEGMNHVGDADGRVRSSTISCRLSMFEVRSALWVKEEVGLELRFVHQQPDGRRRLDWRRKTNSIVSRDLVVISISFRAFPARKGCTVLPLVLI